MPGGDFYLKNNSQNPWHQSHQFCQIDRPINELAGKKIGILGYGNLGQSVAKIAVAMGMQVLISERPNVTKLRDGRVSFEVMLASADVVSLHCPLNDETNNLFDAALFAKMKNNCIFINTSRGPVVNSLALAEALRSHQIGHAIIDVLETEPPAEDHPLLQFDVPNLTLTHHIAWGSMQAQQKLIDGVAGNIRAYQAGDRLNRVD